MSERDGLLSTGAYTVDDYLIQELNARIDRLLRDQEKSELGGGAHDYGELVPQRRRAGEPPLRLQDLQ